MFRLYLIGFAVVLVVMVYLAGMHAGYERANRILSENNTEKQNNIIKIQEKINAETVNNHTDDIRNFLRVRYTIAD
jgi:hypothetical protein